MSRYKVLVLCGSQRDLDEKGEPNSLANSLKSSLEEWNKSHSFCKLELILKVCSADRTPFLLAAMINEEKVDGIIYIGSYSLVLGAAIQECLGSLRAHEMVNNVAGEFSAFMEKGHFNREYFPGGFSSGLLETERSKYFRSTEYIPTVAVPCIDLPSQGQSAFISVVETPSGSEPRPVVGIKRVDVALKYIGMCFSLRRSSCRSIKLVYEDGNDEAKEGAFSINGRLKSFGSSYSSVASLSFYLTEKREEESLVCFISSAYSQGLKQLKEMDEEHDYLVYCPVKEKMQEGWPSYLTLSSSLDSTVHLGVGGYDNTALLLTRLCGDKKMIEGMWNYRNEKTLGSIVNISSWMSHFTEVCV